jgi:hypothetical protein
LIRESQISLEPKTPIMEPPSPVFSIQQEGKRDSKNLTTSSSGSLFRTNSNLPRQPNSANLISQSQANLKQFTSVLTRTDFSKILAENDVDVSTKIIRPVALSLFLIVRKSITQAILLNSLLPKTYCQDILKTLESILQSPIFLEKGESKKSSQTENRVIATGDSLEHLRNCFEKILNRYYPTPRYWWYEEEGYLSNLFQKFRFNNTETNLGSFSQSSSFLLDKGQIKPVPSPKPPRPKSSYGSLTTTLSSPVERTNSSPNIKNGQPVAGSDNKEPGKSNGPQTSPVHSSIEGIPSSSTEAGRDPWNDDSINSQPEGKRSTRPERQGSSPSSNSSTSSPLPVIPPTNNHQIKSNGSIAAALSSSLSAITNSNRRNSALNTQSPPVKTPDNTSTTPGTT